MQISSRFTIAVHVLICIEMFKNDYKVTSDFLASSVNVNPVVIRRLLQQLKKAGLIHVKRGSGGADIGKNLEDITLLDVYRAVECVEGGKMFHFHENPNLLCPVGKNIHTLLDGRLKKIQEAMEKQMCSVSIKDIVEDAEKMIQI
ncbi:MAG: Rrf2 family transcriptional regulator [Lachnospiraceae bacterium]|nr:Rrf2 family transcriptional regulator [Lachnospiraceae bacterium]